MYGIITTRMIMEKTIERIMPAKCYKQISPKNPRSGDIIKKGDPNSGGTVGKEAGLAPNGLERRLKDIASRLDEIVSKSNIVNNTLREKLGTMTIE